MAITVPLYCFRCRSNPQYDVGHLERIAAIERGGVPLDTGRINTIARNLGLEVSRHAPAEETIQRIRQALERAPGHE